MNLRFSDVIGNDVPHGEEQETTRGGNRKRKSLFRYKEGKKTKPVTIELSSIYNQSR
jgi:hypothetical protein